MRPLFSRLKPRAQLRQPNIPTAIACTFRTVTTTAPPPRAEESVNETLKQRLWGENAPTNTPPQIPAVEADAVDANAVDANAVDANAVDANAVDAKQSSWVDPTQVEGYVPNHDGRGLRVVGIVSKLGKKVEDVKLERLGDPQAQIG